MLWWDCIEEANDHYTYNVHFHINNFRVVMGDIVQLSSEPGSLGVAGSEIVIRAG